MKSISYSTGLFHIFFYANNKMMAISSFVATVVLWLFIATYMPFLYPLAADSIPR